MATGRWSGRVGEELKKSLLEIYALAVCFAMIVCFVISLGAALYSIVGIASPEFTMNSYTYSRYQSNDNYWLSRGEKYLDKGTRMNRPSEDELTRQRQEGYRLAAVSERRDGFQTLAKAIIILLINTVAFFIHWRIAGRARQMGIAA